MHEMTQDRRGAKAQGVERADLFTNLLNASEMEKGDGGGLSDLELTGTDHIIPCLIVTASHCPSRGRQHRELPFDNREL
jgi:hypothetical protein